MTTNPQNQKSTLELAKKGNPRAIAVIISQQLNSKRITVKAGLKNDCLQIFLESVESPEKNIMIPSIKEGISNLELKIIRTVKVYARQTGYSSVAWIEEFSLTTFVEAQQKTLPENPYANVKSIFSTHEKSSQGNLNHQIRDSIEGLRSFITFCKSLSKQQRVLLAFGAFYILWFLFSPHDVSSPRGSSPQVSSPTAQSAPKPPSQFMRKTYCQSSDVSDDAKENCRQTAEFCAHSRTQNCINEEW